MSNSVKKAENIILTLPEFGHVNLVIFIFIVILVLHFDTAWSLTDFWWNSFEYGHGLLIAPICIYFISKKWTELTKNSNVPSLLGVTLLVSMNLVWFLAYLSSVQNVMFVAFVAMFPSVVWAVAGREALTKLKFPMLYILVALPVWEPIKILLQTITVNVVEVWLDLVRIPSYVEGNYINIPEGQFLIETACAGLRYFLAALAVSSLYAHLYLTKLKYIALFIVVSLFMVTVVNWIRVFFVIVAGHATNMQHFLVKDHADFGWLLFIIILVPIFMIGRKLASNENSRSLGKVA